jgi:hypothetical protein
MSTRDEVRRELKELAKLAETIRSRKERALDEAPPSGNWSALASTDELAAREAQAYAPPQPRLSSVTVPPVTASQPSGLADYAGAVQPLPFYRQRAAVIAFATGAALVCAVAATAAVGRSGSTKPPVAATRSASPEGAPGKPATSQPAEPNAATASPARAVAFESLPVKTSPVVAAPPALNASRPTPKPAIARARPASSTEQSLEELIRKAVAAPTH